MPVNAPAYTGPFVDPFHDPPLIPVLAEHAGQLHRDLAGAGFKAGSPGRHKGYGEEIGDDRDFACIHLDPGTGWAAVEGWLEGWRPAAIG